MEVNKSLKYGRCGICNINFKSYEEAQKHFESSMHLGNTQDETKVEKMMALSLLENNEETIKKLLKEYIYNTIVSYSLCVDGIPLSYTNEEKRHDIHGEIAVRLSLDYSDKVFHIFWELENYTSLEKRPEDDADENYTRRNFEKVNQITNEAYIALHKELEKEAKEDEVR